MRRIACLSCLSALVGAACNGGGAASSFGTVTVTTAPGGQSSGSTDDGAGGSSTGHVHEASTSAGSSGGTTLVLDVGGPDLGSVGPEGCRGKIDFLFVISRFGNGVPYESDMQNKLIAAAPKFLDTIKERFADFDYHIMVIDDDATWGSYYCDSIDCGDDRCTDMNYPCGAIESLTSCDQRLGAGTIYNAGEGTLNKPCGVAEGKRYLDRDQPELTETFECIARVGLDGGNDRIVRALVDAVTPERTGDCNAGFLRDDALLLVTIANYMLVSAYPPEFSPGKPEELAQAIIDAKHGDAGAVVMLNITPMSAKGWTDLESCADDWYFGGGFICRLLEYFPYRMAVDNSIPDYAVAFEQAAGMVDEACSAFAPR